MHEPTEHRFRFAAGPYAPGELEVASVVGSEAISTPFGFDIDAIVNADRGSIRDLLGGRARLSFHGSMGRQIDGIVTRIEAHPMADDLPVYRFHLAPTLWLLSLRKTSRVFQDMTAPEIVRAVLSDSRIEQAWGLERTYPKREYCVQYRETDLAFVTRLLAEEGIFYFFADPSANDGYAQATVVFADSSAEYSPILGDTKIRFRNTGGLERDEHVVSFSFGEQLGSGSILHRSFDFKRPLFELRGEARFGGSSTHIDLAELSVYEHDNDPEERQIHASAAQTALAQLRVRTATGAGYSTCQRLVPGGTFELWDHPHGDLCRGYAVVRVDHEVHQVAGRRLHSMQADTYKNCFYCVPNTVAYRPERRHRELQQVTETATVVGPAGEEIHVDEYGRIKVQFHWDRYGKNDEHSSCWLRAMQPWAGASWGSQFTPRIGMEVVVTFVGGDVDRPMVLGSVNNALHPVPYALPANKTQSGIKTNSTPGGAGSNELRFEDAAGKEQLFVHAQKDFDEVVENDHTRTVKGDEAISVGCNSTIEIGGDQETTVQGNEVVSINKNLVVHVVGRQIIHVDGKTSGDDGKTAATPPGAPAAPVAPTGGAGASDGPSVLFADAILAQRVADAKLLFLREQVPETLYSRACALTETATLLSAQVTELQQQAPAPVSPEGMAERAKKLRDAIGGAIRRAIEPVPPALHQLHVATITQLQGLQRRTDDIERGLLTGASGSARGGGGGDVKPWKKTGPGKDSVLQIRNGGGTVESPDGLTFKGQGGEITVLDGNVKLHADDQRIDESVNHHLKSGSFYGTVNDVFQINAQHLHAFCGSSIKLICGGSSIEMTPDSIMMSSTGPIYVIGSEVTVSGVPIKLN